MSKRKATNEGNTTLAWTSTMDDALIEAYLHQHTMGNRVGGTFTTHALENIVMELKRIFPDKPIDKEKVQNRMKNLKKKFARCYDIFKNGMSGFAWNPTTETWDAEPEVWQHLIESKPEATEWMNKSIRNYDKLVQLYGKDRATGQHAETASEMRQRRAQNAENTIDEIDFMVTENMVNLENLDENMNAQPIEIEDEASPMPTNQHSRCEVQSSSKSKKVKGPDINENLNKLGMALEAVASSIEKSTSDMIEASHANMRETKEVLRECFAKPNPYEDFDVWAMLTDLGVSQALQADAYLLLAEKPRLLEPLIKCPSEHRKDLLLRMMGQNQEQHGRNERD